MTKSDFAEWKRHPVTQEIFRAWADRRNELVERLPSEVAFRQGDAAATSVAIMVYDEILNMEGPDGN